MITHVPGCDGLDPMLGIDLYHCRACLRNAQIATVAMGGAALLLVLVAAWMFLRR